MKRSILATALAGVLLLTACGEKNHSAMTADDYNRGDNSSGNYVQYDESAAQSEDYNNENGEAAAVSYKQSDVKAIDTQMLVYSCNMSIDVLDFESAVDQIHDLIDTNKGFIESENFSDGADTGRWTYSSSQKWKTLTAVIRVPSANYDSFCSDIENVGDMRRKSASVQNLNSEYSDLKTTLSIYEAKEQRYLDILAEIKSESEALSVENELTDIQVEIAKIKTRMNNIENDVAYSYVDLTLNEVREYTEEPVIERTDTFGQRLKNTLSRTWNGFLEFLEGLLFVIIRVLPYLLLLGIIAFIIVKIIKLITKLSMKRAQKRPRPLPPQPPINAVPPMNGVPPMPQNGGRPAINSGTPANNAGAPQNTPNNAADPQNSKNNTPNNSK